MKNIINKNGKFESFLYFLLLVLFIILCISVWGILKGDSGEKQQENNDAEKEVAETTNNITNGLSDSTIWFPENCLLYDKIPLVYLTDINGKKVSIDRFKGKPTIIVIWASWCTDCNEQMENMKGFLSISRQYGDFNYIFLNKTDGSKETKEKAIAYYEKLELFEDNSNNNLYFDEDLSAFDTLGVKNIPTTLFLDKDGKLIDYSSSQIVENGVFEAYVSNLIKGKSFVTAEFIQKRLMSDEGGIMQSGGNYNFLSESQGLMLEYALLNDDKVLFDKVFNFIRKYMITEKGVLWSYEKSKKGNSNALLDDMRIYYCLHIADDKWGGYEEQKNSLLKSILKYSTSKGHYVDFYDLKMNKKAERLSLCYINTDIMNTMKDENSEFKSPYIEAKKILDNGLISDDFPMYYSWYDYNKKEYQADELNMAEALLTCLYAARGNEISDNTLEWIRNHLYSDGIKSCYSTDGKVVEGYEYESTAVYGIVALIGMEIDDKEMVGKAVLKMEKQRITNTDNENNGAFSGNGEVNAFDQLIPVLVYQLLESE